MAPRSNISKLPNSVQKWLDTALIEGNFSQYCALEKELKSKGFDISKSAIHRYGQQIERKLASIKASTQAAKLIVEGIQDDENQRSEAAIALLQSSIFNVLLELEEAATLDPLEQAKLFANLAKSVAELTRASISNKKYATEIKAKIEAKFTELATKEGKTQGFDMAMFERIKREVYGVL